MLLSSGCFKTFFKVVLLPLMIHFCGNTFYRDTLKLLIAGIHETRSVMTIYMLHVDHRRSVSCCTGGHGGPRLDPHHSDSL